MLHLRVICPADRTDAVLQVLTEEPGATHLVLHRGVAVAPVGDVLEADIAREAADAVLRSLCALEIDHTGAITLENLDTVMSDAADTAQREAPGSGEDAVVWDELIARTGQDAQLGPTFLALLTLACLIAAVGVVTDSPVTVVGAMVVGPEFGPLAALAVGLVLRRSDLIRRAATALTVGFPVAMAITTVGALAGELAGLFDVNAVDAVDQVDFIYDVGPYSLIVALLAGAAGMLSLITNRSAALVGVFISVTTVPAAGLAVVALVTGEFSTAAESGAQLLINLLGIVVAGVVVLLLRTRRVDGANRPLAMP